MSAPGYLATRGVLESVRLAPDIGRLGLICRVPRNRFQSDKLPATASRKGWRRSPRRRFTPVRIGDIWHNPVSFNGFPYVHLWIYLWTITH